MLFFFGATFFLLNIRDLKISTCHSIAIGEDNKKKILENDKNVQKQPLKVFVRDPSLGNGRGS